MNVAIESSFGRGGDADETLGIANYGRLLSLLDTVNAMAGHYPRKSGATRAAK
jgi:hypothetical protein